ncbi:MAG: hypothetical protein KQA31_01540 [Candidatus Aenigmarchaeota archaeon]|nr:hypothetical protein [Candidatus Aenigmarchaeota archaeon]
MAKSQVATEYLIIVVVGLLILIPIIIYLNDVYISYKDESKVSSAKLTVNKLASLANWVYSQGEPARATSLIYIPEGVVSIDFSEKMINFRIKTKSGFVDVSENAPTSIDGSLPIRSGYYNVLISATNDTVKIIVVE